MNIKIDSGSLAQNKSNDFTVNWPNFSLSNHRTAKKIKSTQRIYDPALPVKKFIIFLLFFVTYLADAADMPMSSNRNHVGYREEKISDDIFQIYFSAIGTIFSNKPAWDGWKRRAKFLCNNTTYKIFDATEGSTFIDIPYTNRLHTVSAYAICNESPMTEDQIREKINDFKNPPLVPDAAIVKDCKSNQAKDQSSTLEAAEKLMQVKRYSESIDCFKNVITIDPTNHYAKKAYQALGSIYEIGLGVDKDKEEAMKYYKKSL